MTNLQEILQAFSKNEKRRAGEFISGTHISEDQAQAAIAELVEAAIPRERLKRNGEPTTNMATAEWGYNQALKEIRNNLKAKGII